MSAENVEQWHLCASESGNNSSVELRTVALALK